MEQGQNINEVYEVLGQLGVYLEKAKRVPLTNQCVIDRAVALDFVQRLDKSMSHAIKEGKRILDQESSILADAKKHYENLTAEAEAKANKLRMESEQRAQAVVADASAHADQLVADAQRQADTLVSNAQRQADELVAQTAIMMRAEQQANEIVSNAKGDAERLRLMVRDHCTELYKRCENEAITVANELRDARIKLDQYDIVAEGVPRRVHDQER